MKSFDEHNLKDYRIYKKDKIIYDKNLQFLKCSKLLFKKIFLKKIIEIILY